ncbi:hypothetical protein PBY51_005439 [Eleginops maclovinus]|uniref:Uncharacterized protein n=1 Tax=Eleginops maclovinus TaxID=56733 RepID=A0AAN7X5J3_ELEMC|nr:hypothetical protein PBY51_005439 [Eleginops maclovinus]
MEVLSSLLELIIKPYINFNPKAAGPILSVQHFYLRHLFGKRQVDETEFLVDEKEFFDPQYDCDFTHLSDSAECMRGDEPYERPKGWYRMALKVKGKYPDGDAWLGTDGWRSHSVDEEWPVSYHGQA